MRIVTLASLRGAPGVTTTVLLLASTLKHAVVVEADPDGGVLAVRYGLGREPGLATLAASGRDAGEGWRAHAQDAGGVPVLVGPDSSTSSAALWRTAGERITQRIIAGTGTAVVDAGRFRTPGPIVTSSDLLMVLVCPVAEQLVALTHVLPSLRQSVRGEVAVVLVGEGPYRTSEIERSIDVPVLAELPHDRYAAESLRTGTGVHARLARTRLARAVAALGACVDAVLVDPVEVEVS